MKKRIFFEVTEKEIPNKADLIARIADSVHSNFGFHPLIDSDSIRYKNREVTAAVSLINIPSLKDLQKQTTRHLYNEMEESITETAASNHWLVKNGSRGSVSSTEISIMLESNEPHHHQDFLFVSALLETVFSNIVGLNFISVQ